jgi:hypothetical protein
MNEVGNFFPALSVRQPWADFIVIGLKDVENRSKATRFRGTILIHASRTLDIGAGVSDAEIAALEQAGLWKKGEEEYLPSTGAIIGMVDIVDCVTAHDSPYFEGPHGWVLKNAVLFDRPIEFTGKVGIFYVPRDLLRGTPAEAAAAGTSGTGGPKGRAEPAASEDPGPRFWVWVTGPEHYLDDKGAERADLEPAETANSDDWWTCHRDTKRGDLILLYRTRPKQDVAYLLEAATSARVLATDKPANSITWADWGELMRDAGEKDATLQRRIDELTAAGDSLEGRSRDLLDRRAAIESDLSLAKRSASAKPSEGALAKELQANLADVEDDLRKLDAEDETLGGDWIALSKTVFRQLGMPEDTQVVDESKFAGDFVCNFVTRYRFDKPLPLAALKADALLTKHWGALRGGFRQRVYSIPVECWERLIALASPTNPGLEATLAGLQESTMTIDAGAND